MASTTYVRTIRRRTVRSPCRKLAAIASNITALHDRGTDLQTTTRWRRTRRRMAAAPSAGRMTISVFVRIRNVKSTTGSPQREQGSFLHPCLRCGLTLNRYNDPMAELTRVTVSLEADLLERFDRYCKKGRFA